MGVEWFADCFDETYIEIDQLRYPDSQNRTQAIQLAERLGMNKIGNWLDACCGWGRLLLPLCSMGYKVTGVDLSRSMIQALKREAKRRAIPIHAHLCDIRLMAFPSVFHGAYLAGTSFGMFDDPQDDHKALEKIHQCIRPGGKLLMDQCNPTSLYMAMEWGKKTCELRGQKIEEFVFWDDDKSQFVLERKLQRGSWERQWLMRYRYYDATTLTEILLETGFLPVELLGDFDGSPFRPDSPRMIIVAIRR